MLLHCDHDALTLQTDGQTDNAACRAKKIASRLQVIEERSLRDSPGIEQQFAKMNRLTKLHIKLSVCFLFRPLGTLADRALYFARVNLFFFIDCVAGEIIRLVASVCVCVSVRLSVGALLLEPFDL